MTRLYIQNEEVELDNSIQFAITKQFEDITNPTVIINEWSKSVDIPFTQKNDKIFGNLWSVDRVTTTTNFDPYKKISFRLDWGEDVLMQGYLKVNEIKQSEGKGYYNVTLFGELGKVFSEMKKITFDENSEDLKENPDYYIKDTYLGGVRLNKELVESTWRNGQYSDSLMGLYTNFIGFAPNNSFNEGFQYDAYQVTYGRSQTFKDVLGEDFYDETGISADTVIKDGLLPRQIGEYRSWLQLPFIYWNKLFRIFTTKAQQITGYNIILDDNWFDISNPYWYDLVYMLDIPKFTTNTQTLKTIETNYPRYQSSNPSASTYTVERSIQGISADSSVTIKLNVTNPDSDNTAILTTYTALKLRFTTATVDKVYYIVRDALSLNDPEVSAYINNNPGEVLYWVRLDDNTFAVNIQSGPTSQSTIYYGWINNNTIGQINNRLDSVVKLNFNIQNGTDIHSNYRLSLNDMWNNEYNLFNEILKYCKMYRIGIILDDIKKTITFKALNNYFSDYKIEDWTNKVDKLKDWSIKPITIENKYLLFNTEDSEVQLIKDYKEKYGVNYGNYKLDTNYNFNNDSTDLLDGIKTSIVSTDNVLSWTSLYNNKNILYSFANEVFVKCADKDNKYVSPFGQFYFHRGFAEFKTDLNMRKVVLSDDTQLQIVNNTYFYSQDINNLPVTTYPNLGIVRYDNCCLFTIPLENYTYDNNYFSLCKGIYENFWERYIEERYNVQNKIVTCYLRLTPKDYIDFQFNHFIKINNQLYMVNKIYDYNVDSNESTKVDLITVQNITGYTQNRFNYGN